MTHEPNEHRPSRGWFLVLRIPFIGVLWVPFYNDVKPMLWGVPPARLILPVPPASLGFSTSVFPVQLGRITIPCDAALASLIANLIDTIVLTPTFNALSTIRGRDETAPFDYREA